MIDDMAKPAKPAPVVVGDLKAVAHRPPIASDPRWSWRCRKANATIWTGRAHREDVVGILIAILQAPTAAPEPNQIETLGQVIEAWVRNEIEGSSRAPGTITKYQQIQVRVQRVAPDILISRGQWALGEFWRLLEAEGRCSFRSIQQTCTVLLMAWRWAHGYGFVSEPPPRPIRKKAPAVERGYTPTLDEALDAISKLVEPSRSLLTVQLSTGARLGEVCMLERADVVDTGDRLVLTLGRRLHAQKTGAREVPVTMPAAIAAVRLAIRRMNRDGRATGRIWLKRSGRPVTKHERGATTGRLRAIDWAGARPFTSHGLRRLAVKQLRQSGVPLEVAAGLLGHSIEMMLKVYREIDQSERVDAMERARLGEVSTVVSI